MLYISNTGNSSLYSICIYTTSWRKCQFPVCKWKQEMAQWINSYSQRARWRTPATHWTPDDLVEMSSCMRGIVNMKTWTLMLKGAVNVGNVRERKVCVKEGWEEKKKCYPGKSRKVETMVKMRPYGCPGKPEKGDMRWFYGFNIEMHQTLCWMYLFCVCIWNKVMYFHVSGFTSHWSLQFWKRV